MMRDGEGIVAIELAASNHIWNADATEGDGQALGGSTYRVECWARPKWMISH